MSGLKRAADYQLTSENQDDEADHEYETAPSIASKEELSKRRILKVRRDANSTGGAETPLAPTGGIFKNLRQTAPDPALIGKAPFGFSGKFSNGTNGPGATTSGDGVDIVLKPVDKLQGGGGADAPAFTFGAQTSSSGTAGVSKNPSSSFSFTTTTAGSNMDATRPNGFVEGDKTQDQKNSHLFGASTFSFAGAVRSFVDARKRLEEDRKNVTENTNDIAVNTKRDDARDEDNEHKDGDTAEKFEPHSIVASSGKVLASAPCRLFLFDTTDKKWLDRGESEAKIKHEDYNVSETTSGNAQDAAGVENSNTAHYCYRLLVRNGYSLNSLIGKNVFVLGKEGPKHILFSVSNPDGAISNYLLKFTGPNGGPNTKVFIEEIQKAMSDSGLTK